MTAEGIREVARPRSRFSHGRSSPSGTAGSTTVMDAWRRNVGEPVSLDIAPPLSAAPDRVDVLCWNLAIGQARLDEVVDRVLGMANREAADQAVPPPLVLLVQEAYRADETVPELLTGRAHGGAVRRSVVRLDIPSFARDHGFSLIYAPSMRNGPERSDRGNAVLSSVRLGRSYAFSLPLVRQRRVAVASELTNLDGVAFVSAHLENRGLLRHGPAAAVGLGSTREAQAAALGQRITAIESQDVVLGSDLNTVLGRRDPAFRGMLAAGFVPAVPVGRWTHTFHGVLRLPLDHVLYRSAGGPIRRVEVWRLDENPRDRGARIFGSDHHPLLARVHLGMRDEKPGNQVG